MAKKVKKRSSSGRAKSKATADAALSAVEGSGGLALIVPAMMPEPGDRPIGALTDAQVGAAVRLICAQGNAALIFRFEGQLFLRVVDDD